MAEATALGLVPLIALHTAGLLDAALGSAKSGVDFGLSTLDIKMNAIYLAGYQAASDILGGFVVWTAGMDMLQSAHALGISYDMPTAPTTAAVVPQGSGP